MKHPFLLIPALVGLLACSSAAQPPSATFPADPYMTVKSAGGLQVELRTSPQPPEVGNVDVELTVTDASGNPRDGLGVSVKPWMPAMNHGTSGTTITPEGGGKYLVTNVYLYMSGVWQLQIAFAGTAGDHVEPEIQIP